MESDLNLLSIKPQTRSGPAAMRLSVLAGMLSLVVHFNVAASDFYAQINRLRAGEGGCVPAENLSALKPQRMLEQVAGALAQGDNLQQGMNRIGYRATRSIVMSMKGDMTDEQVEQMLARQGNCPRFQDPAFTEAGIYADSRQVWVVLAAPFAPTVALS